MPRRKKGAGAPFVLSASLTGCGWMSELSRRAVPVRRPVSILFQFIGTVGKLPGRIPFF